MTLTVTEQVRLLIADTNGSIFTDTEIAAFLSLNGDELLLAAAMALDTMAVNIANVLKKVTLMGTETDGPAVAAALRAQAASLRERHKELSDDGFACGVVEFADDVFQQRERIWKDMLRHSP